MKRKPVDASERGACRYSQHANLCECDDPASGKWGCTRKPGHSGDHIATDGKYVRARWPPEIAQGAQCARGGSR